MLMLNQEIWAQILELGNYKIWTRPDLDQLFHVDAKPRNVSANIGTQGNYKIWTWSDLDQLFCVDATNKFEPLNITTCKIKNSVED